MSLNTATSTMAEWPRRPHCGRNRRSRGRRGLICVCRLESLLSQQAVGAAHTRGSDARGASDWTSRRWATPPVGHGWQKPGRQQGRRGNSYRAGIRRDAARGHKSAFAPSGPGTGHTGEP